MKFALDHNLSPRYAAMLRTLGEDVSATRDLMAHNASDLDMMNKLSEQNWVLISADVRITRRKEEVQVLQSSGVSALFINPFWMKRRFWDQAVWILRARPVIRDFASQNESAPFHVAIQENCKIIRIPL